MLIKITLPIYTKFKKKDTLVGMNIVRNLHYTTKNKWKQNYHKLVWEQLKPFQKLNFDGYVRCEHKLYYKNANCDMNNVCSMIDKYTMDAIQEYGIIKNDNVLRYNQYEVTVGGKDIVNPRVEVFIFIRTHNIWKL